MKATRILLKEKKEIYSTEINSILTEFGEV